MGVFNIDSTSNDTANRHSDPLLVEDTVQTDVLIVDAGPAGTSPSISTACLDCASIGISEHNANVVHVLSRKCASLS